MWHDFSFDFRFKMLRNNCANITNLISSDQFEFRHLKNQLVFQNLISTFLWFY